MRCVTLSMALALAGCLIPPPLEAESSDGGPNHPPQILWETIQPPLGTLTRSQTAPGATKKVSVSFLIIVSDPDPQTLFLNIFLDGVKNKPTPYSKPIRSEQAQPTSTGKRAFILDLDGPCDELVNYSIDTYSLEFYVSDTGFLESEQRLPKPGGQATSIAWRLVCTVPPPSTDGGH